MFKERVVNGCLLEAGNRPGVWIAKDGLGLDLYFYEDPAFGDASYVLGGDKDLNYWSLGDAVQAARSKGHSLAGPKANGYAIKDNVLGERGWTIRDEHDERLFFVATTHNSAQVSDLYSVGGIHVVDPSTSTGRIPVRILEKAA